MPLNDSYSYSCSYFINLGEKQSIVKYFQCAAPVNFGFFLVCWLNISFLSLIAYLCLGILIFSTIFVKLRKFTKGKNPNKQHKEKVPIKSLFSEETTKLFYVESYNLINKLFSSFRAIIVNGNIMQFLKGASILYTIQLITKYFGAYSLTFLVVNGFIAWHFANRFNQEGLAKLTENCKAKLDQVKTQLSTYTAKIPKFEKTELKTQLSTYTE